MPCHPAPPQPVYLAGDRGSGLSGLSRSTEQKSGRKHLLSRGAHAAKWTPVRAFCVETVKPHPPAPDTCEASIHSKQFCDSRNNGPSRTKATVLNMREHLGKQKSHTRKICSLAEHKAGAKITSLLVKADLKGDRPKGREWTDRRLQTDRLCLICKQA